MHETVVRVFFSRPVLRFALREYYQLKAHYKKSAGARTFARLMTLLDSGAGGGTSDAPSTGGHDHDSPKAKHSKVGQHFLFFVVVDPATVFIFCCYGGPY